MSNYASEISPPRGARHRFPFGTLDGFSHTFHFRLSSLTFGARGVSKNKTIGLGVLLEWDESLSGSARMNRCQAQH